MKTPDPRYLPPRIKQRWKPVLTAPDLEANWAFFAGIAPPSITAIYLNQFQVTQAPSHISLSVSPKTTNTIEKIKAQIQAVLTLLLAAASYCNSDKHFSCVNGL